MIHTLSYTCFIHVLYLRWQDNDGGSLFSREQTAAITIATSPKTDSFNSIEPQSQNVKNGRKLALLIGVSQYGNGFTQLPGAIADIEAIKRVLQSDALGDFDEVQVLLGAIDLSTDHGVRNRAMLESLYACGLRVSELVELRLYNTFLDLGFIKVTG